MKAGLLAVLLLSAAIVAIPLSLVKDEHDITGPCDPLVPDYCLLPYPNNFWTSPDSRSETGIRLNLSTESLPKDNRGRGMSPREWNAMDGFSAFPAITTFFPNIDITNLPHHWNASESLEKNCPTVLLDAHTGEKVAHFAEIDEYSQNAEERKMLMIWPLAQLKHNRRYIVGIRFLKNTFGRVILPSEAFIALRDGIPSPDPDVESRRTLFEDIFKKLASVGVERNDLQIAWDFNTMSENEATKRMLFMRDDSSRRIGPSGPRYTITEVKDDFSNNVFRQIKGQMYIPSYMSDNAVPGSYLIIDPETQLPVYQGDVAVNFTVMIPRSLSNGGEPGRIVQYGHGLFGSQEDIEIGYFQVVSCINYLV
eukprot:TRINITY_DN1517_c0_g1_i2.p1 TRINITY_DN1517_c0_g1~~TRINITY_DN1517_c0_g1_i2.p1  ORF type:complete len:366 (+),score=69.76 TRINITY_DN1517_c0_g1_i2:51-1148(+)